MLWQIHSTKSSLSTVKRKSKLRKTRSGDDLMALDLGDALRSTLGEVATVDCMEPKATVKLRDLDKLTTNVKEVTTGVDATILGGGGGVEANVFVSKLILEGRRRYATVTLTSEEFPMAKCIGRSKICYKCGRDNHRAGTCTVIFPPCYKWH